jgi:hypothetical protein
MPPQSAADRQHIGTGSNQGAGVGVGQGMSAVAPFRQRTLDGMQDRRARSRVTRCSHVQIDQQNPFRR